VVAAPWSGIGVSIVIVGALDVEIADGLRWKSLELGQSWRPSVT
jgi:hypothetical protein